MITVSRISIATVGTGVAGITTIKPRVFSQIGEFSAERKNRCIHALRHELERQEVAIQDSETPQQRQDRIVANFSRLLFLL